MRPLAILPPTPAEYDEAAQWAAAVDYDPSPKPKPPGKNAKRPPRVRTVPATKLNVANLAQGEVDDWVTAGCPMLGAQPAMPHPTLFTEFQEVLELGGMSWGDARKALMSRIGFYCSYCESPIYSTLDIEHVAPKSTFPEQALAWDNFLLACAPCNSCKSNGPNQGTVDPGHAVDTADALDFIKNRDAHGFATTNYLWPLFDWATEFSDGVPYPFRITMCWIDVSIFSLTIGAPLDDDELKDVLAAYESGALECTARSYFIRGGYGNRTPLHFAAVVQANPKYKAKEPHIYDAARRVIEVTNLQRIINVGQSSNSGDWRFINRTKTWFRAKMLRKALDDAIVGDATRPPTQQLFPRLLAQAKVTVRHSGFWLVWLSVLGNLDIPGGRKFQDLLRDEFPGTSSIKWRV